MLSRTLAAVRSIFSRRGEVRPLALVEALRLESNPAQRLAQELYAAQAIAAHPDPEEVFAEVADAYLRQVPRPDVVPDGNPERRADLPASVPSPDEFDAEGAPVGPLPVDDRRDVGELETAGRVLVEATLHQVRLRQVCAELALDVRLLAGRVRRDPSGAARLRALADRLRDAAAAAGARMPALSPREGAEQIQAAVARGADTATVQAMADAGRDWDALIRAGNKPQMSRSRFVELSTQRKNP